jgi:hypothetical protein
MPGAFEPIAQYEHEFDLTIQHGESADGQADRGVPHICQLETLLLAESENCYVDIIVRKVPGSTLRARSKKVMVHVK